MEARKPFPWLAYVQATQTRSCLW